MTFADNRNKVARTHARGDTSCPCFVQVISECLQANPYPYGNFHAIDITIFFASTLRYSQLGT